MRTFSFLGLLCVSLLLGGCFRFENDPGEGGVTIGEARELDEIAADLDARPQAPGVSLGNASDDSNMTGAVTQEPQEVPVPANPAAIKEAPHSASTPTQSSPVNAEQKQVAPKQERKVAPPALTAKVKEPQATPAKSVAKADAKIKDVPLKKSEPKPARPKPVPAPAPEKEPTPAKQDSQ